MERYEAYKDSGVEWIGEIPVEWDFVRLKMLCRIETGNSDTQDAEPDGAYPFYVRSPIIERSNSYTFDGEGILMAGDGAGAGRIFHHAFGKYAVHQRVYRISSIKDIDSRLLFHFLSSQFPIVMDRGSAQSTVPSVRKPMLDELRVCIPPRSMQETIVNYLENKTAEIDSLVADCEREIELLQEYRKAIISETVTKGLDPTAPMKDSDVEWIGRIPASWDAPRMKDLCSYRNGLTYSPDNITDATGTLVLRSSNIQNGMLAYDDCVYVDMEIPEKAITKKGDILICSRNGSRQLIGKNALIEHGGEAFGAFMMIARPLCESRYFYYLLNGGVFNYYLPTYLTSTVNQLTAGNFGQMYVPFTRSTAEQIEIANYLDDKTTEIDSLIEAKQQMANRLREYRKSLISEAVTGKFKVPEVN